MRFGSVCSGIEAASVAWNPLGWEAAWFSEIEPFPCALLAHHYPNVPNLGDMTTIASHIRNAKQKRGDYMQDKPSLARKYRDMIAERPAIARGLSESWARYLKILGKSIVTENQTLLTFRSPTARRLKFDSETMALVQARY